ncbi:TonB-dependent receptor [Variovorax ginsengisoli]|uniref:Iron complex outermembrane receptor protein n=1 Tax=Variovorax ginsengisoli TaxID=363844 RepID=A0ABT9S2W5_9BURK|nr:TonB-dependent siderophore receptor [Variovorax ginsengisoli]MDP9898690.1 iron complex outermembrane receptor protein [Variovorax ginsengisoli]
MTYSHRHGLAVRAFARFSLSHVPCAVATLAVATGAHAQNATLAPVTVQSGVFIETPQTLTTPQATGSRLGLTAMETPASVDVIEGETLRQRGDQSIADAASRATGITQSSSSAGGALAARGFAGNTSVMRLYDGTRQYVSGGTVTFPFDPWQAERIEVLRGPASVLFGEGAIGGAINTVPKKPTQTPISNEVRLAYGSQNTVRTAFGSGGAINEQWSYRVDLSRNRSDGDVDRSASRSLVAAGALRLDVTPDLHFTLSHDDGKQAPSPYFGMPLVNGRIDPALRNANFNVSDAELKFRDQWTRLDAEWTPSSAVTLRNSLYRIASDRHWQNAENYAYVPATGRITRSGFIGIDYTLDQVGNRFDATLKHAIGGFANTLTVGFDINRLKYDRTRNDSAAAQSLDPYNFVPGSFPTSGLTVGELFTTQTDTRSLFAEDQFKLTETLALVGGLRWDSIDYAKQDTKRVDPDVHKDFTHTSGRIGAVYALTPTSSVYAQYATAADPLGGVVNTTLQQSQFDLSTGKQTEVGWKQLFDGRKGEFTLAAYRIEKNKLLIRDAVDATRYQQVGAQSSRGIEASLSYAPTSRLRFDLNGALLDARYDDFNEVVANRVVSRNGNTPPGVPEKMANAWATWAFLPKWEAGFGVRYVGPRQVDNANSSRAPSFTVADASLRWAVRPGTVLALHAYNLTDRVYAQTLYNSNNQWVLGRPRSVELSAHVRF